MRTRVSLLAFAFLLAAVSSARAQYRGGTVEINPFAGYMFGGNFGRFDNFLDFDPGRLEVDDHAIYGGRVGYNFTNLWEIEVEYAQSDTHLSIDPFDDRLPDERVGDMKFEYFLAYLTLNFGHGRWVPYFTIGSGGANLVSNITTFSNSEVRYTGAIGGGVKWFLSPHFAFRFDARLYSTWINNSQVCGPGFCTGSSVVSNVNANGGFVVAF